MVVVDADFAVVEEATERLLTVDAVVERTGGNAAVRNVAPLDDHPGMQHVPQRLATLAARREPLVGRKSGDLLLDAVQRGDALQRRRRNRTRASLE